MNDIDLYKSFFEQGGTSIKALKLVALLRERVNDRINVPFFFEHLSVANLVHDLTSSTSSFE
jgi:hypothetical protein